MERKWSLRGCVLLVLLVGLCAAAGAEQVERFDFTGVTRTEQVKIKINEKEQVMEYLTPSRESTYSILSYDMSENAEGDKIFTATVVDQLYNIAYEVLLYVNRSYADIRIGSKRLTFSTVRTFSVVEQGS